MRHKLRVLLLRMRLGPEERELARSEQCLEACFDPECAPGRGLRAQDEAELEAERRRWTAPEAPAGR
jgi:hypothetical protein